LKTKRRIRKIGGRKVKGSKRKGGERPGLKSQLKLSNLKKEPTKSLLSLSDLPSHHTGERDPGLECRERSKALGGGVGGDLSKDKK